MNKLILLFIVLASSIVTFAQQRTEPVWKSLPIAKPVGHEDENIKCYLSSLEDSKWKQPPFVYNQDVAVRPVKSKVIVVVFNPVLHSKGNTKLIDYLKAHDPKKYSKILADVVNRASNGYVNYDIVDYIETDEIPVKTDGFQYTPDSLLKAREASSYRKPDRSNYRKIFEDNKLIEKCKKENISEIWLWGAGGMGFDELAMYIPNRYARFAPTENPWFYRPYEIPPEIGHTVWVMGFNYEVGVGNMIHSYNHRVESIIALVFAHGIWDKKLAGKDPFNTFTVLNMDFPDRPSQVGNTHVPPNGKFGYDYTPKGSVMTYADAWPTHYPDMKDCRAREFDSSEYGNTQAGYQEWFMFHIPSRPGYTKWGYNNWWVYIANTDENLPFMKSEDYHVQDFKPAGF